MLGLAYLIAWHMQMMYLRNILRHCEVIMRLFLIPDCFNLLNYSYI